ncbi:MAG: LysE family translocator [Gammaproteobacteria bacterium]|nr:LysE family translocator [Gammaproteobacteria bacterium]
MTLELTAAFAGAFFVLALSPGPGLAAILSRALGGGLGAGLAVTAGLVLGDAVFLGIAMIGLSATANTLGPLFQVVKYAGAAYLMWLGFNAIRSASKPIELQAKSSGALMKDVGLGLMVTLGNPKPILFYGALLPTFLDLATVSVRDFAVLMAVVLVVSFVVYGGYMLLIERTRALVSSTRTVKRLNQTTGVVLIGSGLVVASR